MDGEISDPDPAAVRGYNTEVEFYIVHPQY